MRLQVGVLLVGIGEFSRFRTSWHTIGTLDWSHVAPWKYLLKRPRMTAVNKPSGLRTWPDARSPRTPNRPSSRPKCPPAMVPNRSSSTPLRTRWH